MKEEYDSDKVHYIYHYCIRICLLSSLSYRDGILRLHDPIETEDDYRDLRHLLQKERLNCTEQKELHCIGEFSIVSLTLISN